MVHVMEDISLTSKLFDHFSISFTPCELNSRADRLAKAARSRSDYFDYIGVETPVWLVHVASLLE